MTGELCALTVLSKKNIIKVTVISQTYLYLYFMTTGLCLSINLDGKRGYSYILLSMPLMPMEYHYTCLSLWRLLTSLKQSLYMCWLTLGLLGFSSTEVSWRSIV